MRVCACVFHSHFGSSSWPAPQGRCLGRPSPCLGALAIPRRCSSNSSGSRRHHFRAPRTPQRRRCPLDRRSGSVGTQRNTCSSACTARGIRTGCGGRTAAWTTGSRTAVVGSGISRRNRSSSSIRRRRHRRHPRRRHRRARRSRTCRDSSRHPLRHRRRHQSRHTPKSTPFYGRPDALTGAASAPFFGRCSACFRRTSPSRRCRRSTGS